MHPYFAEALLLRSVPYRDSDVVATLLTPSHGAVAALAKGARKSRKRFGAALDFFNVVRAEIKPSHSGMATLLGVEMLHTFNRPRLVMEAYFAANHFLELVRLSAREGDSSPEIYGLLLEALTILETGFDPASLRRVYQVRLLALLGYSLGGGTCSECGCGIAETVSFVEGAPRCGDCCGAGGLKLGVGGLKTLGAAHKTPMGKLRIPPSVDKELGPIVEAALIRALGVEPRTLFQDSL